MFKDKKKNRFASIKVQQSSYTNKLAPVSGEGCPVCGEIFDKGLIEEALWTCPACKYHYPLSARSRIQMLVDEGSFKEFDATLKAHNLLGFPGYDEKLKQAREETGENEAIITGTARIAGQACVLGVMESAFMMGSMGTVVGDKICRTIRHAIDLQEPLILVCASGGARMQEGIPALKQMARTSAELAALHQAGLLYVSLLTHPTTGGVSASFASLADIILAEPGALIAFTGPRVIEQTIGEHLPQGFQKAEFLQEHGMVDGVVYRSELRKMLGTVLSLHSGGKYGSKTI